MNTMMAGHQPATESAQAGFANPASTLDDLYARYAHQLAAHVAERLAQAGLHTFDTGDLTQQVWLLAAQQRSVPSEQWLENTARSLIEDEAAEHHSRAEELAGLRPKPPRRSASGADLDSVAVALTTFRPTATLGAAKKPRTIVLDEARHLLQNVDPVALVAQLMTKAAV